MDLPPLAVALALAVALLAGCSDAPTAEQLLAPDEGALAGVVVDPALRPLEGAVARIPAAPEVPPATTGADGTFRFQGLRAGLHIVQVEKPGYLSATVQATASAAPDAPLVNVVLEPLDETRPYVVLETFEGFLDCGVGSAAVFGFTTACRQTASAALAIACAGQDPVPPTGVCLGEADPYFRVATRGNMTTAQAELTWNPTLAGAELLLLGYVFDPDEQVVGSVGSVTGPPYLAIPMPQAVVDEHDLGGANHVGLYVSAGSRTDANVAAQQPFRLFHTAAYFFELPTGWAFVEDGLPQVPPTCTTCLVDG